MWSRSWSFSTPALRLFTFHRGRCVDPWLWEGAIGVIHGVGKARLHDGVIASWLRLRTNSLRALFHPPGREYKGIGSSSLREGPVWYRKQTKDQNQVAEDVREMQTQSWHGIAQLHVRAKTIIPLDASKIHQLRSDMRVERWWRREREGCRKHVLGVL